MKGAPPLFSRQQIPKSIMIILTFLIVVLPTFLSSGPVRGADPTYSVTIIDYAFQPAKINITTGTTVVWTYVNTGKDYHTVTSDPSTNKTQSGAALLNSGSMSPGQTFSYKFDQPGYYPYQCSFHPTIMNAWVNVTGTPVSPSTSQSPPDLTLLGIAGGIVGIVIVAALALFLRKKRRTSIRPVSAQNKS